MSPLMTKYVALRFESYFSMTKVNEGGPGKLSSQNHLTQARLMIDGVSPGEPQLRKR